MDSQSARLSIMLPATWVAARAPYLSVPKPAHTAVTIIRANPNRLNSKQELKERVLQIIGGGSCAVKGKRQRPTFLL